MHGVPEDLDLRFLRGARLIQVCLGEYEIQLHFHPVGSISVEGDWDLLDVGGQQLDRRYAEGPRPPFQLHRLLGQQVVGSEVAAPEWFALRFEHGDVLRVFDRSVEYESFSIQPGDIYR
ncbi:MAG: hypothetical protein K0Q72_5093 [Armatimonadetes bacterium]|jgi:hypothetical protein|nr:hypothetical protein [Armatimonadota bacterium]